jgi:SAM-dependent methyltransferase
MSAATGVIAKEQPWETVACNLCGRHDSEMVLCKSFYDLDYTIVRCAGCGLVYVSPRRVAVESDEYFTGPYLATIEESGKLNSGVEVLYADIIRLLDAYVAPGRLLDVGCAMGHFMHFARRHGWDASGVESSPYAAQWGRENFGVPIHPTGVLTEAYYPPDYCDAAVLVEVVEHLPDPRATLAEVFRILKPGGAICLTTPNFDCYRSLLMREEWAPIIPSGHLYYFTHDTLGSLLKDIGFTEVTDLTKPGSFQEDLEFARAGGQLRLDGAAVENLRAGLAAEDALLPKNRRGEGLVLGARKPAGGPSGFMQATARGTARPDLEGKLVQARLSPKIFFVCEGVKYWVMSPGWIQKRGLRIPEDVHLVDRLDMFPEGFPIVAEE